MGARAPRRRLQKMAAVIGGRSEDFAALVSAQNGMPISTSRQIEGFPAATLLYYSGLAREQRTAEHREGFLGGG